jgi:hypothetical protein
MLGLTLLIDYVCLYMKDPTWKTFPHFAYVMERTREKYHFFVLFFAGLNTSSSVNIDKIGTVCNIF